MDNIQISDKITSNNHKLLQGTVIELLKNRNIETISHFLSISPEQLTKITKLQYKDVILIRKNIIKQYAANTFTAFEYYQDFISNSALITTGIREFDLLLGGGLMTGSITELYGATCSGKTHICYSIAVSVSQRQQSIYYIDTKNDFQIERLMHVLITQGYNPNDAAVKIKENILVEYIPYPCDLLKTLHALETEISSKYPNIRVIIIDSFSTLFFPCTYREGRFGLLNIVAQKLNFLAKKYYLAIFVTSTYREECSFPIDLGQYWKDVPSTKLLIKRNPNETKAYFVEVMKSSTSSATLKKEAVIKVS